MERNGACHSLQQALPIDDDNALQDIDLPRPAPTGRDLLVEVKAVSVNPVDTKVRRGRRVAEPGGVDRRGL